MMTHDDIDHAFSDDLDDGQPEEMDAEAQAVITMVDQETGDEYQFVIVDDFDYKGEAYCVLVTVDESDPELVITRIVELDDGEEGLMSLEGDEADDVYAEYDRLCEEAGIEDEIDTE